MVSTILGGLAEARIVRFVVACAAVLTVVGIAGLVGQGHRVVDIAAQFVAPALLASVLMFAISAVYRHPVALSAAALASITLGVAIAPQWRPPLGTPIEDAPVMRLYSANVYYRNGDVERIRASIEAADADIVVLIELGRDPARRADDILRGYPYRVASTRSDEQRGPSRSLIAARYPLEEIPRRPDGLHAVAAVARTPLGSLNVIGVHLTRPWPFQEQWGQVSQVLALGDLRRTLEGPTIIAGDFNSVANARIGRQMKSDMGLTAAPGFPGTWPANLPAIFGITIDQVWRSPDLAFLDRRLGRRNGSDHRPVIVDFTRAASPPEPSAVVRGPTRESHHEPSYPRKRAANGP